MTTTPVPTHELKILAAKNFKDAISTLTQNNFVYFAFGRADPWSDENNPPGANNTPQQVFETWSNMAGAKRLTGSDVYHVAKRYDWTSGTVYFQYDHTASFDENNKMFVVNSSWNVYKCIANNSGVASTVEPTSLSTTNISQTADGYKWKFMYSLTANERDRFMTTGYIPVKYLSQDDGSLQWQVQENAVPGAIYQIDVTSGGANYTSAPTITITGDGTGAQATAGINNISNVVNTITVTNYGTDYTYASAIFSGGGGGSGAVGRVIISPPLGHGANPVGELGGTRLILNPKIQNSESGVLSVNNQIRQVSLIVNPNAYATANQFSNAVFSQTLDLQLSNFGLNYIEDEIVYQGPSLASATFRGRVLQWDTSNLVIKLINTTGTVSPDVLVGTNTSASRYVTGTIKNPECDPQSGKLLYVENIPPIIRNPAQTESYKLVINF